MKKLLVGAVVLASLNAAPAMAQAGQAQVQTLDVTGTVDSKCSTFSLADITFGTLATDNATGLHAGGTASDTATAVVWCNKAGATVSYSHVAMTNAAVAVAPAGFTKTVDFVPSVKLGSTTIAAAGTAVGIVQDTLSVDATTSSTTSIPVAGSYAGTITVTLTPGA